MANARMTSLSISSIVERNLGKPAKKKLLGSSQSNQTQSFANNEKYKRKHTQRSHHAQAPQC